MLLATAFRDSSAKRLLERGRAARSEQDSLLTSYDAKVTEEMSLGIGFGPFTRQRLLYGMQRAARVRWMRDQPVVVDILGQRDGSGVVGRKGTAEIHIDGGADEWHAVPIPYFPGRESLWFGTERTKAEATPNDGIIHPLAKGAEAYYTYATGASSAIRLPDGRTITLRELLVRPRRTAWNVVIASIWFDTESGRVVRAVYRMAEPLDVWRAAREEADSTDGVPPRWVMRVFSPLKGSTDAVTVEYGLMEGRFWLPTAQVLEGSGQGAFVHVPIRMEQHFEYAAVNGPRSDSMPVAIAAGDTAVDSLSRAARRAARAAECTNGAIVRTRVYRDRPTGLLRVVHIPCDTAKLTASPDLPKSIFRRVGAEMGDGERDAVVARALSLPAQPPFDPRSPVMHDALSLLRFNRVEGLSPGAALDESLGAGYTATASARIGAADRWPNARLELVRSNGRTNVTLAGYRALVAASDWDDPLSLGSSISGLLFGRDEGFYYRATGGELTGGTEAGSVRASQLRWRLFGEHHVGAPTRTDFSLVGRLGGRAFDDLPVVSDNVLGIQLHHLGSLGLDPSGFRLASDLRLEAGTGTWPYTRAALDLTVAHPLGHLLDASLTAGGGTSGGALPIERRWILGGFRSIRGEPAGVAVGDAYWMTHLELGVPTEGAELAAFGDLGWAGDRHRWRDVGRPLSGAGLGLSLLDGLVRVDVAHGIWPERKLRAALYLEGRF